MSEGSGHIQRAILELILAEPDGAWQTSEICHRVYGWCGLEYSPFFSVLKGERAAVSRALRTMKLPGTWEVYRSRTRSGEFWLCDPCNDESMMKREAAELNCYSVKVLKKFYKGAVEQITTRAAEARRYRDATPAGRLAIDIEQEEKKLSFARTWRMTETARQSAERLAELKAQLADSFYHAHGDREGGPCYPSSRATIARLASRVIGLAR
jgi:hypothetical protein